MADVEGSDREGEDRESLLRRRASRQSLQLVRCPSRNPEHPDRSTYGLVENGVLVAGAPESGLGLGLDAIEAALTADDARTGHREIDVRYDADYEPLTFDDRGTPILTYGIHAQLGSGWHLWTTRDDVDRGGGDFFGGSLADVDTAVSRAQEHLQRWARTPAGA